MIGYGRLENLSNSYHEIPSLQYDLHLLSHFHEWNKTYMIYKKYKNFNFNNKI